MDRVLTLQMLEWHEYESVVTAETLGEGSVVSCYNACSHISAASCCVPDIEVL